MSMTLLTAPGPYFSANGDLIFVVYESVKANDPATYPDYKYVADVYIGDMQVVRIKKVPAPDNKMGVFNIGDVVRNYVQSVFNPELGDFSAQELALGQFFINATVKFGEEYSFTLTTNVLVDDERTYFSHYNGRMFGQSTILGNYADAVASNRPLINYINSAAQNHFIPYFATTTDGIDVTLTFYDDGNNEIGDLPFTITPTIANTLQLINVGVAVDFIACRYFTVQFNDGAIYTFNVTCEPRFDVYTLHFLNKLGGFETREFTKVSRKVLAITKTEFGKLPYTIDSDGNVNYYNANNVYNEQQSVYASQYTEKITLNTDILSDAEYQWLAELVLSPLIYVEMNGYFIPTSIIQSNYTFNKFVNDKLTNLTIDINFGDQFATQFR